ncbi:MFS transporter [Chryseobacterium fluminis]|uniref:spinster family MFS transporter n=1 Tax=Chryseobacterium fluminis TaxID=2983606 RepID=UPI002253ED6A|nr:MFS transporter [Chryseobacterium sp. MMS21-Ot14]UZT96026.1 MFS transporter [Chryseobacterium sp. MMS21-Ot14]
MNSEISQHKRLSRTKPNYALLLLTLVFALGLLDRVIFNVLLDPIREEFHLSDTIMGLLSGFAFVAFYSAMTFPIARLADRYNRRNIIVTGLTIWSAMTAFSGLVTNILQLTIARILVGFGESMGSAPGHSLLSDFFPKHERPKAFSIYSGGLHLGILLGYIIAGLIGQMLGWRYAFFFAGVPGLLLALIIRLTMKEPIRGSSEEHYELKGLKIPLRTAVKDIFRQPSYRLVLIATTMGAFVIYAFSTWEATFLRRIYHFDGIQIGLIVGTVKGGTGLAGAFLGGWLCNTCGKKNYRYILQIPAIATFLCAASSLIFLFSDNSTMAIIGLGITTFFLAFHIGVAWGVAQTVTRVEVRTLAAAILTISCNLIGHGLGSSVPGFFNDLLSETYHVNAIRYSLLSATGVALLSGLIYWRASHHIEKDINSLSEQRKVTPTF